MASLKQKQIEQLDQLAKRLENSGVYKYVELSQRTWKVLWFNFLSGAARGLGFTIGTTIVLAIVYKIVRTIISMNIPYLTELLNEFIEMIKT